MVYFSCDEPLAPGTGRNRNRSFPATGITADLKNGGTLEKMRRRWRATPTARHSSTIVGAMT
jgi:hypothetical protein